MSGVNAVCRCDSFAEEVRIALVGKYVRITDAYASVNKALKHAAIHAKRKLIIEVSFNDLFAFFKYLAIAESFLQLGISW